MKIRKQFQKQADELLVTAAVAAVALLEPLGNKKAALFSTEACTSPHEEAGGGAPTLQQLQEDESNSGSCGDWTSHGPGPDDLHNNVRRKYARRSLRSAGLNDYSNEKPGVVAQVIQRRSTPRGSGGKAGHPSEEPEGSLVHCLYLQLLAAGSEGMTLKEIFASFASQTRFSSLGSNWREQVKSYLTSNPAFKGVKARYFLSQEIDQKSESASPDPSEGVQTRRKTYERTIEAVLNESVAEYQKASQKVEDDVDDDDDEMSTASMTSSEDVFATPPRKRKSSSPVVEIQEPMDFRHTGAVPGSLKAMQARIVAETGGLLQSGARCSRKDGSNHHSKWQCPMMAMEGKSLCQHHNFLSERKKARYKRAKRIAAGKPSSPPPRQQKPPQIIQDLNKPPRDESPPPLPPPPVTQRVPRTRSDAQSLAESANMTITEPDMDSETEVPKSRSVNPTTIPEPAGRQSFRSTRKPRLYLAAKKTAEKTPVVAAVPGKSMKKQSVPLIRPPSIPPLPMLYGVRRKSMKNRPPSQLLL